MSLPLWTGKRRFLNSKSMRLINHGSVHFGSSYSQKRACESKLLLHIELLKYVRVCLAGSVLRACLLLSALSALLMDF